MKESKRILFDYKRNKKRLEQMRTDYASIGAIRYDKPMGTSGVTKTVENAVIGLTENPEYKRLNYEIDVVDRVKEQLTYRQELVIKAYFFDRQRAVWLERNLPLSIATAYRDIDRILDITEREMTTECNSDDRVRGLEP